MAVTCQQFTCSPEQSLTMPPHTPVTGSRASAGSVGAGAPKGQRGRGRGEPRGFPRAGKARDERPADVWADDSLDILCPACQRGTWSRPCLPQKRCHGGRGGCAGCPRSAGRSRHDARGLRLGATAGQWLRVRSPRDPAGQRTRKPRRVARPPLHGGRRTTSDTRTVAARACADAHPVG
jgi:hypothetical protein